MHGPRIVFHGGAFDDEPNPPVPVVSDIDGAANEAFVLGTNVTGEPIRECHHPAWSVSGARILCMAHREPSRRSQKTQARALYSYAFDQRSGKWLQESTHPLFDPPGNTELRDNLPSFRGQACDMLTYKFAEWCGTDRFVVMTMFCSTGETVTASRVVIGDLSDGRLYDLTTHIESHFPSPRAVSTRAIYATCHALDGIHA